ncbi:uncharacterized protein LOC130900210 [Diorhabda carinulata]|uniref:uncharacterized protein LOC130900210 n=1 Tax=Diorhabda carinulata TaxID=1163345 RepID=UPI0025A0E866|nr:uncharacterized protein LOC130900210 [Diorhabda carinulata]
MSFLYIIIFYIIITITEGKNKSCEDNKSIHGLGTVLFTSADIYKQCWSQEEIAILSTRLILEDLLPDISILNIDCNDFVEDIVSYFRLLIEVVKKATRGRKKRITLLALTDLLGAYLQYAVLPVARYSYYAGVIDYTRIAKLIQLFEEIKWFLRTNGQGWPKPMKITSSIVIEPINFDLEKPNVKSCCDQLIFFESERRSEDDNVTGVVVRSHIDFPLPFFDSTVRPNSIAVPFKRYPLRNIESRKVSYILMKFFIGAVQCLKEKKTETETQQRFLNNFFGWIKKDVLPKLEDDKFYSAFGGILRVDETLKTLGAIAFTNATCLPEGEQEMAVPGAGGNNKKDSPSLLLIIMLVIIIIWFVVGTAFICYRMRRHRKKPHDPDRKPEPDVYSSSTTVRSKWSIFSKNKSDRESTFGKCKCSAKSTPYSSSYTSDYDIEEKNKKNKQKKDKSVTICYPPPFAVPYRNKNEPAIIETKTTMKKLPSIEEISEITVESKRKRTEKSDYFHPEREQFSKKQQKKGGTSRQGHMVFCENLNSSESGSISHSKFCKKKHPSGKIDAVDECWCDILGANNEDEYIETSAIDVDEYALEQTNDTSPNSGKPHKTSSLEVSFKDTDRDVDKRRHIRRGKSNSEGEEDPSPGHSRREETTADELSGATDKEISSHPYACHSSLTGDYANRNRDGKPHIFGYDFQTSSSSEFTEEETDLKTSTSK